MKTAYFDLIAGASGDMILGALVDAGLSEDTLHKNLEGLLGPDFSLEIKTVNKNGFRASKVDVFVDDDVRERKLTDIESLISGSDLPAEIKQDAIAIFRRLGAAEATIHMTDLENVHLHELGGVDTIVDVVGTLMGLDDLGIKRIVCSPVPLGRGFIHGAHGEIPLPAPATTALLQGVPVIGKPINKELVTPTGAVLLKSLVDSFGELPAMKIETIGYGAGSRNLSIPNILRVFIGESASSLESTLETLVMIETNLDDMNPEFYDHVMEKLYASDALDVLLAPIQMKKNRPGVQLQVLARPQDASRIRQVLFKDTSTLGIRQQLLERYSLRRESIEVETVYGTVRLKIAYLDDGTTKASPEYEDCRTIATHNKIPIRLVYASALEKWRTQNDALQSSENSSES